MHRRNVQKKNRQKGRAIEVYPEAKRILREVGEGGAFRFFEDIGKPVGVDARSLPEFLERMKTVELKSILFHLHRRDFQTWTRKTLGDSKLARRLGAIRPSGDDDFRMKVCSIIENRIRELSRTVFTAPDSGSFIVASPSTS